MFKYFNTESDLMRSKPATKLCPIFLMFILFFCFAACKKDKKSDDPVEVEIPTVELKEPIVSTFAGNVLRGFQNGEGLSATPMWPTITTTPYGK